MSHVQGMDGLQHRLEAVKDSPKGLNREWGLLTVRLAKAKVRRKTGTTGRTIRLAEVGARSARVEVGGAGIFLEKGTRPHIIRPKNAKVLRFPAQGSSRTLAGRARAGGRYVFAKLVRHPGTKAYPFLMPAAKQALDAIGVQRIIDAWNKAD